jgi:hypothetical protein
LGIGGDEEDGALAAAFAAGILGRLAAASDVMVLWFLPHTDLYGPGLATHGLDPRHLVLVRTPRDAEILWAMEEGLRAAGLAAVVGEVGTLAAVASRRLQLAAERSGVTAFLLRRWRDGGEAARERDLPNAAATRWRIAALPSQPIPVPSPIFVVRHPRERACETIPEALAAPRSCVLRDAPSALLGMRSPIDNDEKTLHPEEAAKRLSRRTHRTGPSYLQFLHTLESGDPGAMRASLSTLGPRFCGGDGYQARSSREMEPGVGRPRWRVELLRCRGGAPACWEAEVREGRMTDATGPLSVADVLADRPAAPIGNAEPKKFRRAS